MKTQDRLLEVTYKDREKTTEILYEDSFTFHGGKVYGIIGEIGAGGWAISYLLSGKVPIEKEQITINGIKKGVGECVDIGWYAGEGLPRKNPFHKNLSVIKQIRKGLKKSKIGISEEEIIRKFNLTKERLNCRFSYLSWESWRASVAIGYAYGKKIFCFPFVNTAILNNIITNSQFPYYISKLKNDGMCVIIPTYKKDLLELIVDEYIVLNNPRFQGKEFVDNYIMKINELLSR